MISMTKLYDYLNGMFAFVVVLCIFVVVLCIAVFISNIVIYFKLSNTVVDTSQFVQNSVDDARQNIRDDLKKVSSELDIQAEELNIIRGRTDWIADNIGLSHSGVVTNTQVQLVHYIAEVEVCTGGYSSYKVKVDFYGINPRIENNRLLIIDERMFSSYDAYNVYLPISDKNTDLDADLCSIRVISSSNK